MSERSISFPIADARRRSPPARLAGGQRPRRARGRRAPRHRAEPPGAALARPSRSSRRDRPARECSRPGSQHAVTALTTLEVRSPTCATGRRRSPPELAQKEAELAEAQSGWRSSRPARPRRSTGFRSPPGRDLQVERAGPAHRDARGRRLRRPARAAPSTSSASRTRTTSIVGRVRELRDQTAPSLTGAAVRDQIEAARNAIAAHKQELEQARATVEQRAGPSSRPRAASAADLLGADRDQQEELEGDLSDISAKIAGAARRLGAARAARRPDPGRRERLHLARQRAVTSGFGMRWGRMHEGVDISVPSGTPIRAASSGSIALARPNGGYGNYTCISPRRGLVTRDQHLGGLRRRCDRRSRRCWCAR